MAYNKKTRSALISLLLLIGPTAVLSSPVPLPGPGVPNVGNLVPETNGVMDAVTGTVNHVVPIPKAKRLPESSYPHDLNDDHENDKSGVEGLLSGLPVVSSLGGRSPKVIPHVGADESLEGPDLVFLHGPNLSLNDTTGDLNLSHTSPLPPSRVKRQTPSPQPGLDALLGMAAQAAQQQGGLGALLSGGAPGASGTPKIPGASKIPGVSNQKDDNHHDNEDNEKGKHDHDHDDDGNDKYDSAGGPNGDHDHDQDDEDDK